MKIFVSVDMEGIAGISCQEQIFQDEPYYQEGRRLLTDEVNVVVEALVEAGATEIVVKDAHASGFNFQIERLHPAAKYVQGPLKIANRFPGLDSTFTGALLIGYHGMAGTPEAILDHTFSSKDIFELTLNGAPIGEIGFDALLFGLQGVPVIFVSGDDKTCLEAKRQLGNVATYSTKTGMGRSAGILKSPQQAHHEIGEAVKAAVRQRNACTPYTMAGPYEMKITYNATRLADAQYYDGAGSIRLDGRTRLVRDNDLHRVLSKTFM